MLQKTIHHSVVIGQSLLTCAMERHPEREATTFGYEFGSESGQTPLSPILRFGASPPFFDVVSLSKIPL